MISTWIIIIIIAYFFFAVASLGDKLVLGYTQSPALYTFYVGVLSILALVFIPFAGIAWPSLSAWPWIGAAALALLAGLYTLYAAVQRFEVSRVVPVVGALQPIFIVMLTGIFFGAAALQSIDWPALAMLLLGSVIISLERRISFAKDFLAASLAASLLVALGFVASKAVFLSMPFFQGIIWIAIITFACSLTFLAKKSFREMFFSSSKNFHTKALGLVLSTQSAGAVAGLLQNWAIFLAPVSGLAMLNALRGVQYVFLFGMASAVSLAFPGLLRESFSLRRLLQKLAGIAVIVAGLALLVVQ